MPKVYCWFNENGYYINGAGIEICRLLSPLTANNKPIYTEIQHLYRVLLAMLMELYFRDLENQYYVFNDSRIIDDMNDNIKPLDIWDDHVKKAISREVIPKIRGMIWFIKKSSKDIEDKIEEGKASLLKIDDRARTSKIQQIKEYSKRIFRTKKDFAIAKFKNWRRMS